jgi:hypothetical protein
MPVAPVVPAATGDVGVMLVRSGLPPLAALGVVLVLAGLVVLGGGSGGLDERMRWQVLPHRFGVYPLAVGAALLVVVTILWLLP